MKTSKKSVLGTEEEQLGFLITDDDLIECEVKPSDSFEEKVLRLTSSKKEKGSVNTPPPVDVKNQMRMSF